MSLQDLRAAIPTGNARPILDEIAAALDRLLSTGAPTVIDLGALPFTEGDERVLEAALGAGELRAELSALGTSQVVETGTPGVWRIDHADPAGAPLSRFVEVTFMPEILQTQRPDAVDGLARLRATLARHEQEASNG